MFYKGKKLDLLGKGGGLMHLIIETKNGEVIDTRGVLKLLSFVPSPPKRVPTLQGIEGRRGSLLVSNDLDTRTIDVRLSFSARDVSDFILKRDEIFGVFDSEEEFFVIDSRQPFKRWKVVCESFNPEYYQLRMGIINLTFIAFEGMSESTSTTLTPVLFDSESWGIGQNVAVDDLVYKFNQNEFSVYNAGDIEVDPREKSLVIQFIGASENLKIHNRSTGDIWQYFKSTSPVDVITIDRVYSKKNNISIFNDTNRKVIMLKKGWNRFLISGPFSTFQITFDFRFYYL